MFRIFDSRFLIFLFPFLSRLFPAMEIVIIFLRRLFVLFPTLSRLKMMNLLLFTHPKQVGQAKDELLTSQLIDHLMGESDGMPKVLKTFSLLAFLSVFITILLYSALFLPIMAFASQTYKIFSLNVALGHQTEPAFQWIPCKYTL